MGKPQHALDYPDLTAFLSSLPADEELARLADAFAATVAPLAAVRARPAAIGARIAAIDQVLIDAPAREAAALLAERATLAAELLSLPVKAEALAARFASAELGYLRRAYVLAHAEGAAGAAELAPHQRAAGAIHNRIILMENSARFGDEKFAAIGKMRSELAEVGRAATPLERRVAMAQPMLDLIDALVAMRHGQAARVLQEGAHATLAADYGQRVARALRAA